MEPILITKSYNKNFTNGQIIYGKILDSCYEFDIPIYLFDKYANPEKTSPYDMIKINKELSNYLIENNFNSNMRIAFSILKDKEQFLLNFEYIEYDLKEKTYPFMYNNIKVFNDLLYIEQTCGNTIVGFSNNASNITIPNCINNKDVIAIGNYDEYGNAIPIINPYDNTRNLIISDGIKIIDDYAFMNQNIKNVIIPKTLQYLGRASFFGTSINCVDLSVSEIDTIKPYTFALSDIKEIKFPQYLNKLGEFSFYNSGIKNIYLPSEISYWNKDVFYCCKDLNFYNKCNVDMYYDINLKDFNKNLSINNIEIDKFLDIKFKIVGRIKVKDLEDYYFDSINSAFECEVDKHIFLLIDENNEKYEFVIKIYCDMDFEDESLSLEYYINSVNCKCFKVNNYDIEKHLELVSYDECINELYLPRNYDFENISIRKDDLSKISGIKINEKYKFLLDDCIMINTGTEFKPSKEYAEYIINDEMPDIFKNNELFEKVKKEDISYKLFHNVTKKAKEFERNEKI